jgi:ABC-type iron transport system FetAB permease component
MRVLGLIGLLLGLALVAYLVLGYLNETASTHRMLQEAAAPLGQAPGAAPTDLSRKGLEQRLSPVLDRAKERADQADRAAQP